MTKIQKSFHLSNNVQVVGSLLKKIPLLLIGRLATGGKIFTSAQMSADLLNVKWRRREEKLDILTKVERS